MKKKPAKVEESPTPYAVKQPAKTESAPAQAGLRFAKLAKVRETNAQLVQVHRVVLEKLAR